MAIDVKTLVLGELNTNTYIVTDTDTNECIVIDPACEDKSILDAVEDKTVKYILLTHGHFDHIGGANMVKDKTGAPISIYEDEYSQIEHPDNVAALVGMSDCNYKKINIEILLKDEERIPFGNEIIRVLHTPGHTLGGACYVFENSRIIFSGDTLFRLSTGRTDLPGGDARTELRSLKRISNLEGDYKVYCGHGESTSLEYERQNNRYIILSKRIK